MKYVNRRSVAGTALLVVAIAFSVVAYTQGWLDWPPSVVVAETDDGNNGQGNPPTPNQPPPPSKNTPQPPVKVQPTSLTKADLNGLATKADLRGLAKTSDVVEQGDRVTKAITADGKNTRDEVKGQAKLTRDRVTAEAEETRAKVDECCCGRGDDCGDDGNGQAKAPSSTPTPTPTPPQAEPPPTKVAEAPRSGRRQHCVTHVYMGHSVRHCY